jgi:hypothetical protein
MEMSPHGVSYIIPVKIAMHEQVPIRNVDRNNNNETRGILTQIEIYNLQRHFSPSIPSNHSSYRSSNQSSPHFYLQNLSLNASYHLSDIKHTSFFHTLTPTFITHTISPFLSLTFLLLGRAHTYSQPSPTSPNMSKSSNFSGT